MLMIQKYFRVTVDAIHLRYIEKAILFVANVAGISLTHL